MNSRPNANILKWHISLKVYCSRAITNVRLERVKKEEQSSV
jgi:hypothetical protein